MRQPIKQILVVEDDPADAELILEFWTETETHIHVVQDGYEAVTYLQEEDKDLPELMILDSNLPKKDGLELLTFMRGEPDLKHVPVIVLSGHEHDEHVKKCYELGAAAYLVKPEGVDEYIEMIRALERYWTVVRRYPFPISGE